MYNYVRFAIYFLRIFYIDASFVSNQAFSVLTLFDAHNDVTTLTWDYACG